MRLGHSINGSGRSRMSRRSTWLGRSVFGKRLRVGYYTVRTIFTSAQRAGEQAGSLILASREENREWGWVTASLGMKALEMSRESVGPRPALQDYIFWTKVWHGPMTRCEGYRWTEDSQENAQEANVASWKIHGGWRLYTSLEGLQNFRTHCEWTDGEQRDEKPESSFSRR